MRRNEANKLLGKFWEWCPDSEIVDESIYMIDTFIDWLYDEKFVIARKSNGIDRRKKCLNG